MPRGRKPSTSEKKKEVPITEQFKPDDLVWIRLRGYPWWPARVFKEDEAPDDVLEEKRAKGSLLVHFLESNQYLWTKEAVPFRGDMYDKYSTPRPRDKKFTLALKRCHEFEKGEYMPGEDTEEEEEEQEPTKKRKRSTSTKDTKSKSPATAKRKRSDTASPPAKRAKGTDKGKKAAPKAASEKSKGNARKAQANVQVAMSRDVITIITDKLEQEIEQMRPDKILTLLEILTRIAVDAPTLKEVPIMNCLQTLLSSSQSNRAIKQHATRIHQSYSAVVKAHQSEVESATDTPQPSRSLLDSAPAPSTTPSTDSAPSQADTDGDATMKDTAPSASDEPQEDATTKTTDEPSSESSTAPAAEDATAAAPTGTEEASSAPSQSADQESGEASAAQGESVPPTESNATTDEDVSMKEGEKAESQTAAV